LDQFALQVLLILEFLLLQLLLQSQRLQMGLLPQIHLWVLHRLLHLQGQRLQLHQQDLLSLRDLTVQLLQLFLYLLGL
jgi:hypothetical protein